jgi:hypothetical protein
MTALAAADINVEHQVTAIQIRVPASGLGAGGLGPRFSES